MLRLPVIVRIYTEHILIPKVKTVNICLLPQLVERVFSRVDRVVQLRDRGF